jgi:hypothetical protein
MRGSVPPGTRRVHFSKLRDRDRNALLTIGRESGLTYEHEEQVGKPMLWVADTIAWCAGAGGSWRARIAPILYR